MKGIKILIRNIYGKSLKSFSILNILIIYRYVSFLVCLLLYYITASQSDFRTKISIMCMLVIVYSTMGYLYLENKDDRRNTLILSIIELVENGIFLIISGGYASPFIWYFISTVFITAVKLSYLLALLYSAVYFIIAATSSFYLQKTIHNFEVERLQLNTAISCVIIVFVILQLIRYAGKVEEKSTKLSVLNKQMEAVNAKVEKTLKYSIDVYETINIFNSHKNDNILMKLVEHYSYLSGIKKLLLIRLTPIDAYGGYISYGMSSDEVSKIYTRAMEIIEKDQKQSGQLKSSVEDVCITINYIIYETSPCGAFVSIGNKEDMPSVYSGQIYEDTGGKNLTGEGGFIQGNDIFSLFMKIAGIALKQLEFNEIEEQLLISEEQNRIAGEIHDIVLQRLFAISCKLYVLSRTEDYQNLNRNLLEIKNAIDMVMKELRETIYGLSWDKKGKDPLRQKLDDYAQELEKMHDVKINISFLGDTNMIGLNLKRGLYRVICEAMNNAIRHGRASHIDVQIMIETDMLKIQISDNGTGFDYETVRQKKEHGLGLNNIHRIIEMMNGQITIRSGNDQNTRIFMEIPCKPAV